MHVERVTTPRTFEEFLAVAPATSPAASIDRARRRLDPGTEPFWRHATRELFLLRDGRRAVGRIAAIANRAYDAVHDDRAGFFGWFDCPDDVGAARALLEAAAQSLRERGYERLRGPLHVGLTEDIGALVEGFDPRPAALAPWNPPFVPRLLERIGFAPVHERHGYAWNREEVPPPPASLRAPRGERAAVHGIVYRPIDPGRLDEEAHRFLSAYNSAIHYRWRFVPLTVEEARARLREIVKFADLRLVWIAEVGGEPAGVVVAVPGLSTEPEGGRALSAFRALRAALAASRIDRVHLVAIAVEPRFRKLLIGAHLLLRVWRAALDLGVRYAELSGVDEEDEHMHQVLWRLGCRRIRRYRVYERALAPLP